MSDSEDGGDLFGDEGEVPFIDQVFSDQDLASEQDEGDERDDDRDHDRSRDRDDDADEDQEVKVKRIMGVTLHRHRIPRTSKDGTGSVCLLHLDCNCRATLTNSSYKR